MIVINTGVKGGAKARDQLSREIQNNLKQQPMKNRTTF
jgi:hypothetical protein